MTKRSSLINIVVKLVCMNLRGISFSLIGFILMMLGYEISDDAPFCF